MAALSESIFPTSEARKVGGIFIRKIWMPLDLVPMTIDLRWAIVVAWSTPVPTSLVPPRMNRTSGL